MPSFSDDLAAFLGSGHKAVFGRSGSGKTEVAKYLYHKSPFRSVFVTPHDDLPEGNRARGPHGVTRLLAEGKRRIVWRAPKEREVEGGREAAVELIGQLVDDLIGIGRANLKGDKAAPWCTVVIDEVHNYTSKTGYLGPVETLLSEGRKYGIRVILCSQRPARVSLEVLGQADAVFVLDLNPPDAKYLHGADYPVRDFEPWTRQPYHFVLMRGKTWVPYKPLPIT